MFDQRRRFYFIPLGPSIYQLFPSFKFILGSLVKSKSLVARLHESKIPGEGASWPHF